ncbi:hypothetical protein Nepgr_033524 [Nepenthes gracilis]|uniref:Uncharacterized protein n=1 Tax=Nepenthes gracilis TaxID=150966 RepID=A0AAD3Y8G0_NEPGR|nr:hypothetical protein Nepgr_033524 [Nepenthes gracilis]
MAEDRCQDSSQSSATASGSDNDRWSFTSDALDHCFLVSEISQHSAGHGEERRESLSGPDLNPPPDSDKAATVLNSNNNNSSRKVEKKLKTAKDGDPDLML